MGDEMMTKVNLPSRILVLKNMISMKDLEIDEEYNDLVEDIKDECSKFGHILSLKIPRPMMGLAVPGLGKIFIEYTGVDEAKEAKK